MTTPLHTAAPERAGVVAPVTICVIDGVSCAFRIDDVVEVTRLGHVTRTPHARPMIRGVVNVRSRVVPVVTITPNGADNNASDLLVVLRDRGLEFGMVVDDVRETVVCTIQSDSQPQHGVLSSFSRATGHTEDDTEFPVLDPALFLAESAARIESHG